MESRQYESSPLIRYLLVSWILVVSIAPFFIALFISITKNNNHFYSLKQFVVIIAGFIWYGIFFSIPVIILIGIIAVNTRNFFEKEWMFKMAIAFFSVLVILLFFYIVFGDSGDWIIEAVYIISIIYSITAFFTFNLVSAKKEFKS
ncbi:MAG: hypothetical protein ACOZCO_02850 [Bacteroidota bacterium]